MKRAKKRGARKDKTVERVSKPNYYLDIARTVATRSTCLRKKFGAVIVNEDTIVSTGYNGAPRGRQNCDELGNCMRDKLGIPRGERYELCRSVHAEQNAIIAASRERMIGSTLYLACLDSKTGELVGDVTCCMMCKRTVINAGIENVVIKTGENEFKTIKVRDWIINDDSLSGVFGY